MLRRTLTLLLITFSTIVIAQSKQGEAPLKPAAGKIDYKAIGSPMPAIRLVTMDTLAQKGGRRHKRRHRHEDGAKAAKQHITREYTEKDLDNQANLIVMIFNPTCGHCEDQTDQFVKNIASFSRSKIVLMANPIMGSYLPDFVKNHKVNNYPQILVGLDSAGFIDETFLYNALPQINIYGKERKLLKTYSGEIVMDSLKQYAN